MEEITLYKWADQHEGIVKTRGWGSCTNDRCAHISHDPYFEYRITVIRGEILWEGEYGERIVRSAETGRLFYTRCYEEEMHFRPVMVTKELPGYITRELWEKLVARYESPRHEALIQLRKVVEVEEEEGEEANEKAQ
jgi:hypothetical protein